LTSYLRWGKLIAGDHPSNERCGAVTLKSFVGFIVVITILFSYVPVFSTDHCPEGNHMANTKTQCGYLFHCPMVVNKNILQTSGLPLNGRFVPARPLIYLDELVSVIFRPPKDFNIFIPGDEGKEVV